LAIFLTVGHLLKIGPAKQNNLLSTKDFAFFIHILSMTCILFLCKTLEDIYKLSGDCFDEKIKK
jgi:hypothetical protein